MDKVRGASTRSDEVCDVLHRPCDFPIRVIWIKASDHRAQGRPDSAIVSVRLTGALLGALGDLSKLCLAISPA